MSSGRGCAGGGGGGGAGAGSSVATEPGRLGGGAAVVPLALEADAMRLEPLHVCCSRFIYMFLSWNWKLEWT